MFAPAEALSVGISWNKKRIFWFHLNAWSKIFRCCRAPFVCFRFSASKNWQHFVLHPSNANYHLKLAFLDNCFGIPMMSILTPNKMLSKKLAAVSSWVINSMTVRSLKLVSKEMVLLTLLIKLAVVLCKQSQRHCSDSALSFFLKANREISTTMKTTKRF